MCITFQQLGTKTEKPKDYDKFISFSQTAPENRRPDSTWNFGNPRQYDHYGMWDQLGKPTNWLEALKNNPDLKPDSRDNLYHGFSVNPKTGVFLKAHTPGERESGSTTWMETKDFYKGVIPGVNPNTHSLIFDTDLQRLRYVPRKQSGGSVIKYKDPGEIKPDDKTNLQKINSWVLRNTYKPRRQINDAGPLLAIQGLQTPLKPLALAYLLNEGENAGAPYEAANTTFARIFKPDDYSAELAGGLYDFKQSFEQLKANNLWWKNNQAGAIPNTLWGLSGVIELPKIPAFQKINKVDNFVEYSKLAGDTYDVLSLISNTEDTPKKVQNPHYELWKKEQNKSTKPFDHSAFWTKKQSKR